MHIAHLRIENFRLFGEGDDAFVLDLNPGLTALVGENDSGKTAVIDALRLVLGTRDQEAFRISDDDFHQPASGPRRTEIRIQCKFAGLTSSDQAAFAEYLTFEVVGTKTVAALFVNWKAVANARAGVQRRYTSVELRSGKAADGPNIEQAARLLLCATYLRPLRDAERAMSAGRGSRLSQILQHTKELKDGSDFDKAKGPPADLSELSILGIGDFANKLLGEHPGLRNAKARLNVDYLDNLSFAGKALAGQILVSEGDDEFRRRQLLEKLELILLDPGSTNTPPNRGLGSNNLLFMACELLLLASEQDGFPLLIIEEPEAHLHPQRQLRLVQFLQSQVNKPRPDGQTIQVLLSTHSTSLASVIKLENLVLIQGRRAHSLALGKTMLDPGDYAFLERFLDVTKANLFFARGVLIVEGDAENILLPTLARLIGRDLTENGVSIVNVGSVGLRRYARIFQRKDLSTDSEIEVPIACITDLDVMPDCAPEIIGKVKKDQTWPEKKKRKWRTCKDFSGSELSDRRDEMRARASGQRVETFIADLWTLEYDLARSGLAKEVWLAVCLSAFDERISSGKKSRFGALLYALRSWKKLTSKGLSEDELSSRVYAPLVRDDVSKSIAAQNLARILERKGRPGDKSLDEWRAILPPYIVAAIDHVTVPSRDLEPGRTDGSNE